MPAEIPAKDLLQDFGKIRLKDTDGQKARLKARRQNKYFAEYVRDLILDDLYGIEITPEQKHLIHTILKMNCDS